MSLTNLIKYLKYWVHLPSPSGRRGTSLLLELEYHFQFTKNKTLKKLSLKLPKMPSNYLTGYSLLNLPKDPRHNKYLATPTLLDSLKALTTTTLIHRTLYSIIIKIHLIKQSKIFQGENIYQNLDSLMLFKKKKIKMDLITMEFLKEDLLLLPPKIKTKKTTSKQIIQTLIIWQIIIKYPPCYPLNRKSTAAIITSPPIYPPTTTSL